MKLFSGFLDSNEKELARLGKTVALINALEAEYEALSDDELKGKTAEFRARLEAGTTPDEILHEAFAAVREAAKRTLRQRHYDVQLIGGVALHQGKIAEMKTGEGKTLVATLPLYLNALSGRGAHLVTVNDYLARRDPYWMGPVYHALGVSVASIYPMQSPDEYQPARLYDPEHDSGDARWRHFRPVARREAYLADITYGTSSEFGFDYLRDNMVTDLEKRVQRDLHYAIVDEVDNLLIDEARTPLIISGPAEEAGVSYKTFARLVPRLRAEEDYIIEAKSRTASVTDAGITKVEGLLSREGLLKTPGLYDPANHGMVRFLDNALRAHAMYKRDKDYVVKDGEVIIVDEFTGRLMYGRRYSEGLHQAIEAKENVTVQRESLTYATITIQNYFRMYDKLAGMTGTAATEAEEFHKIYRLEVTVIPPNKPMQRQDLPDQIYKTEAGKFRAVVAEVKLLHDDGLPVLIGTVSIEKSEHLADLFKKQGLICNILNAKAHEQEAAIIARAGEPGAITVATNMAGRGVDIVLGGSADGPEWQHRHEEVLQKGGLQIIGTERHDARRIDNQLRGRAGRQGDPGHTHFYLSLEDDIMRRFGGERIKGIMEWVGLDEDTPIENAMITKAVTDVQKRVEGYHFDIRKSLVEYDDVINKHRELIYDQRHKVLSGEADLKSNIIDMLGRELAVTVARHMADAHGLDWDIGAMIAEINGIFPLPPDVSENELAEMRPADVETLLNQKARENYDKKEAGVTPEAMRLLERLVMLRVMDNLWIEHLTHMEQMRLEAGWQTLRQTRAIDAYKREGFAQFQALLEQIQHDVVRTIFHANIVRREQAPAAEDSPMARVTGPARSQPKRVMAPGGHKVGRNEPCPCGSGKKYKHCCGR